MTLQSIARDPAAKTFFNSMFKEYDIHGSSAGPYRMSATNIYKTKDEKFYHLHGSLNPGRTMEMLGLPLAPPPNESLETVLPLYRDSVGKLVSADLDRMVNDDFKCAGTVCLTVDEYQQSEQGRLNAGVGLWEVSAKIDQGQPPTWWESEAEPRDPSQPLAGLKVLDATRIIAAPTTTRGLAELGASVLRITCPNVPDATAVLPELNWGKWNASLDLTRPEDRQRMRELILEADVFISSYRPGVMEKWGFGPQQVLDMCKSRSRGIVVARLNSYGWHGPQQHRSGWQQVSDAVSTDQHTCRILSDGALFQYQGVDSC
jgi:hypothetical protein